MGISIVTLRQQPLLLRIRITVDVGIRGVGHRSSKSLNRAYGIARLRTSRTNLKWLIRSASCAPESMGHLGMENSCDRSYLNGAVIACGELHVERVLPVAISWIGKIQQRHKRTQSLWWRIEVDVFRPKGAQLARI